MKVAKEPDYRTFDEYQKAFYPSGSARRMIKNDDPYKLGEDMAKDSLRKFRGILSK